MPVTPAPIFQQVKEEEPTASSSSAPAKMADSIPSAFGENIDEYEIWESLDSVELAVQLAEPFMATSHVLNQYSKLLPADRASGLKELDKIKAREDKVDTKLHYL